MGDGGGRCERNGLSSAVVTGRNTSDVLLVVMVVVMLKQVVE